MENVGFSKFTELHPRNCVLAGSPAGTRGTHAVCVYICLHNPLKHQADNGWWKDC